MATQTKASDNETLEKPGRRRFTAAFKQAILEKTDQAEPGEIAPSCASTGCTARSCRTGGGPGIRGRWSP